MRLKTRTKTCIDVQSQCAARLPYFVAVIKVVVRKRVQMARISLEDDNFVRRSANLDRRSQLNVILNTMQGNDAPDYTRF